ncbi:retrovirus-related pol polyprotein from transposon TNT 1-94 [Tanacetum coccineum]
MEYQKLFDSNKKTCPETQREINELIENVNQKTYAYGDVRSQNQDLLITISELKSKLKNVEKGLKGDTSVRRPPIRSSSSKNSVLSNIKNQSDVVEVHVRTNKKTNVTSRKNVVKTKKIVANVDVKNALKAKDDVLCVSCDNNVLTQCHDLYLAEYKLSVHSKVRRALFSTPRTAKSMSLDTTPVVAKTRFAVVIQIVLWIVDSGCSKHMTGNLKLLKNFMEKFMGTVRLGNDHFAAITGYGDYVHGNVTIFHVYYVEGLGHILFSVGQFCDGDLEVAFRSKTCYVLNLEGDDLLNGAHESNLYTISISNMAASFPVFLMSKATSTKSWLWHRRLSHLNFGTINHLTKQDLVDGLSNTHSKLELIHMDLCGPIRVESINGKKYILLIIDDYSHYTWVYFLRTKDEAPEMIKKFIAQAAAISTTCFTQNYSLIHTRYNKTPYELLKDRKPNVQYFHVFGSLCYPTNDREDLGKMKPKPDIGIFISYSESSRGFRIYNRGTRKIMETIHVKFDELMATTSKHSCLEPATNRFNTNDSSTEFTFTPSKEDLDNLFGLMYEEYFKKRSPKVSINFIAQTTLDNEDTPSSSSIIIEDNETPHLELVPRPTGRNIIGVKWLWKYKTDAKNTVIRNKSRLVDKGYRQEEGIDFEESFALLVDPTLLLPPLYVLVIRHDPRSNTAKRLQTCTGCHDDCKSTSGGLQFLGEKLVSYSSKKQDYDAMSTAKAEGTVELYIVSTEYQLADLFTKALLKEIFEYLVHRIGMRCMTPMELDRLAKLSS